VASVSPEAKLKTQLLSHANSCKAGIAECANNDFAAVFEPMGELLSDVQKALSDGLTLVRDQALMVTQVTEAAELIGLLSYENNDKAAQEAADITKQIVTDLWSRLPNSSAELETLSAAS